MTLASKLSLLTCRSVLTITVLLLFVLQLFGGVAVAADRNRNEKNPNYISEVQVPVGAPNSEKLQNELIQQGFKDMLVRLSGSDKILSNQGVISALTKVDNYVNRFSYDEPQGRGRILRVQFNEGLVNDLLRQSGVYISKGPKPSVLAWLVLSENNMLHWVGGEFQQPVVEQINTIAKRYNIPVVFPMLDLTDTGTVTEQMVANKELAALKKGSRRYSTDVVLVGKLSKQPAGWYAEWTLIKHGSNPITWDDSDTDLNKLISECMAELNNQLRGVVPKARQEALEDPDDAMVPGTGERNRSNNFENELSPLTSADIAVTFESAEAMSIPEAPKKSHPSAYGVSTGQGTPGDPRISSSSAANKGIADHDHSANRDAIESVAGRPVDLRLGVSGIAGIEQYAKIVNYLRKIPAVTNVEVAEITPHQTIFFIETTASSDEISQHIAKEAILVENPNSENTAIKLLNYKVADGM